VDHLPPSLTHISFGIHFNQSIDNLPTSLLSLEFLLVGIFNQPVDHLPNSLTELSFNKSFNQPVDHLPSSLRKITFGRQFDQPIDYFPQSLTHLNFDHGGFDREVDYLPSSLTYLSVGYSFNQPVDYLPPSITHLHLGVRFNQHVHNLPPKLIELKVYGKFAHEVLQFLPPTVSCLFLTQPDLRQPLEPLPPSVTHFVLACHIARDRQFHIPKTVKLLKYEVFEDCTKDTSPLVSLQFDFETRKLMVANYFD
jgi:FNIP Repeat